MLKEFKEFAMRGSVLDMAVGIILGVAFGRIITSFVEDILTPPISRLIGRVDFANMFISLSGQHYDTLAAAKAAGGRDPELRRVPQRGDKLPDRGARDLPARSRGEPYEDAARAGRANNQGLPLLPFRGGTESDALRPLHL